MNAGFLILIAVSLITALGFNMITTLISSYAVSFGTELTAVGLISGIFSITALFFRPVGGFLSDFLKKKGFLRLYYLFNRACHRFLCFISDCKYPSCHARASRRTVWH